MLCLGSQPLPWPCAGSVSGWEGALEAAAQSSPGHTSRSSSWRAPALAVAVPRCDRVSSAEQFARAGLARPQLPVRVPGKGMHKGREEGKVPFEKWQGQQESCEGEAC